MSLVAVLHAVFLLRIGFFHGLIIWRVIFFIVFDLWGCREVSKFAIHVISNDCSGGLFDIGNTSLSNCALFPCDLCQELFCCFKSSNSVELNQLFVFDTIQKRLNWSDWICELFNFDCLSQNKWVSLVICWKNYSWWINQHDIFVKVNLLHLFGHTRLVSSCGSLTSFQRVNDWGLADIWEANNTNSDHLLRIASFHSGIILKNIEQVLCSHSQWLRCHLVYHLWVVHQSLLVQSCSRSVMAVLALCCCLEQNCWEFTTQVSLP